ncbi:B12-binding domain-containing radical SAM protein [Citrifermentans bremense]|uniref:B12-binding domain-containing radical SAM protein n=1 Tax=Citrifermentans bremense TaxID=60035 RepID=UPI0003F6055B|nr:B12-binding domain-containing radical SAM protein [Citrifermentans bremense]
MKILLSTLHAKYVHASLALPYLASACTDLPGSEFRILELTVNEQQDRLLGKLFAEAPDVLLFSCYIWNTDLTLKLASDLKQLLPGTFIVLGGPEVSYGSFEMMGRNAAIDCIVRGEGEETCRELLQALAGGVPLDDIPGITYRDHDEVVANPERGAIAKLDSIPSPFAAGLVDLDKPLVYYETSRGCPFSCAFCMSSLENGVRSFSMERIERDLRLLMDKGVQTVKLADRTFNFDAQRANAIWRLILAENKSSKFHFEIAAELLTEENLALLAEVPAGMFRFEIGVQSGGEKTLAEVQRKSSLDKLYQKVRAVIERTKVTVHLDLVAGLPGESLEGFLASLQGLFELGGNHIQVEPLKVLKGTAMRGIARKEGYAYAEAAPYKVLRTPWLSFPDIRRIEAISRLLDLIYNSGRFAASLRQLGNGKELAQVFADAADFFESEGLMANVSLHLLFESVWRFACSRLAGEELELFRDALCFDHCMTGYPGGQCPSFFTANVEKSEQGAPAGLAAKPAERVRYYRRRFARDYRNIPWGEAAVELTFIYRSAPGEGLKVEIL